MAYDFEARHDTLRTRMREVNSRTVTYADGEGSGANSGTISATVYSLTPEDLLAFGITLDVRRRDYIVTLAELQAIIGADEVPERGHLITDGDLTCEVMPLGDGPIFNYTNHQRKAVRIHTTVIAES